MHATVRESLEPVASQLTMPIGQIEARIVQRGLTSPACVPHPNLSRRNAAASTRLDAEATART